MEQSEGESTAKDYLAGIAQSASGALLQESQSQHLQNKGMCANHSPFGHDDLNVYQNGSWIAQRRQHSDGTGLINYKLMADGMFYSDFVSRADGREIGLYDELRKVESGSEEYKKAHAVLDSIDFDNLSDCTKN